MKEFNGILLPFIFFSIGLSILIDKKLPQGNHSAYIVLNDYYAYGIGSILILFALYIFINYLKE